MVKKYIIFYDIVKLLNIYYEIIIFTSDIAPCVYIKCIA